MIYLDHTFLKVLEEFTDHALLSVESCALIRSCISGMKQLSSYVFLSDCVKQISRPMVRAVLCFGFVLHSAPESI